MDVMQKFRDRVRRSSSSDVKNICIPATAMPGSSSNVVGKMMRRYSIPARPKTMHVSELDLEVAPEKDSFGSPSMSRKMEGSTASERSKLCDAYKTLQKEKHDVEERLKFTQEKLTARDATIKELHSLIEQIKEERLQDEEVRYHRSILAKRQYIDSLEAEIEKMKTKIEQDNIDVEHKVRKAKKQISKVKQDCALKIFELKQENVALKEEIAKLTGSKKRISERSPNFEQNDTSPPDPQNSRSSTNTELVLRLSEQISSLVEENSKLKEELDVTTRELSNLRVSAKSEGSTNLIVNR
eukprot:Seg577.2 transcript_id=Seg577.2/GoldUCD/mRNA.D3Y31 product="hypothetical protein" protein_id=Seg577.2/GoldUCD/D3Y31